MWFITTISNPLRFYLPNGLTVDANIDWTHTPSTPVDLSATSWVKDYMQAISALHAKGVVGFKTKLEAKVFGKTLPQGRWKYFEVK